MFDWLFNYPKADFDTGALTFASGFSSWLLLALVLLAAIVLGFSMWRRRAQLAPAKLSTLWLLQTAVASLLLALIWQPTLRVETISAGDNSVATLLDSSASMQVESSGTSRYQQALTTLSEKLLPDLQQHFTVNTATFGSELNWKNDLIKPGSTRLVLWSSPQTEVTTPTLWMKTSGTHWQATTCQYIPLVLEKLSCPTTQK